MPKKTNCRGFGTVEGVLNIDEIGSRNGLCCFRYSCNASYVYDCASYPSVDAGQWNTLLVCVMTSTTTCLWIFFVPTPCLLGNDTSTNRQNNAISTEALLEPGSTNLTSYLPYSFCLRYCRSGNEANIFLLPYVADSKLSLFPKSICNAVAPGWSPLIKLCSGLLQYILRQTTKYQWKYRMPSYRHRAIYGTYKGNAGGAYNAANLLDEYYVNLTLGLNRP